MADLLNTWGSVVTDGNYITSRLRVPGGWLVRIANTTDNVLACCFVPDPGHQWIPTSTDDA